MHVKIQQKKLLQAVDIHRHLTDEIKIQFLKDGIHITSVDPAYYEMVITFIPKYTCDEYNLSSTGDLKIGIDIKKLRDFLRLYKKDDVLTFDYDLDDHRLVANKGFLTRTMGLVDSKYISDPKIPVIDFKNKATVDIKTFYNNLKPIILNKNYEQNKIAITQNSIILEQYDEDEDHDKIDPVIIDSDLEIITTNNDYTVFRSDILIKQVNEYKKYFDRMTIETTGESPIKITATNNDLHVEYWLAPVIPDESYGKQKIIEEQKEELEPEPEISEEVKTDTEKQIQYEVNEEDTDELSEDRHLDPPDQKDDWSEVKEELENEQILKDVESMAKPEIKPMVIPICKPKRQPYNKYQWSQDMEFVKNNIEKHRNNKETKQDRVKKTVEYKGFVFFVNKPKIETELSLIKIKNKNGSELIQKALPGGYVLIAWYKWSDNGWIAQTVKKAI